MYSNSCAVPLILMQKAGGDGERTSGEEEEEGDELCIIRAFALWSTPFANKVTLYVYCL
jgi:hypothetical protein